MTCRTVVIVGSPNPQSRTSDAAVRLAGHFSDNEPEIISLAALGNQLLLGSSPEVGEAKAAVAAADVAVFASPTFKATYTGLLKLFLDQFESGEKLDSVVGVPLMLGGSASHAAAVELHLKPVLVELGLVCPAPGLFQIDSEYKDDPALDAWVQRWVPVIASFTTKGN